MSLQRIVRPCAEKGFLLLWTVLIVLAGAVGWVAKLSFPATLVLLIVVSLVHILSQWVMTA